MGGGFLLSLAALMIAIREQNAARIAVLVGSIAMAVAYTVGFAGLFSTPGAASIW